MSEENGKKDWPTAGPRSAQIVLDGRALPYYENPVAHSDRWQLIKANPPGIKDSLIREFSSRTEMALWLRDEWLAGRL